MGTENLVETRLATSFSVSVVLWPSSHKSSALWTQQLHADILLYNSFYNHPIMLSHASGSWVVEEFVLRKEERLTKLAHLAFQLEHIIEDTTVEKYKPAINFQSGQGSNCGSISIFKFSCKYMFNLI